MDNKTKIIYGKIKAEVKWLHHNVKFRATLIQYLIDHYKFDSAGKPLRIEYMESHLLVIYEHNTRVKLFTDDRMEIESDDYYTVKKISEYVANLSDEFKEADPPKEKESVQEDGTNA